jgi:hypothetical protein
MAGGLNKIVARFGDVLGTNLYDCYGSFVVCVIAIAVVYALILPAPKASGAMPITNPACR